MALVDVQGHTIDVDIEREISSYDWFRPKWRPERLIACSPFRYDTSPSFYVYFEDTATAKAGSWGDSGGTGDHKKGGLVTLLAYLRKETEYETIEYLLAEYASEYTSEDELELDFRRWQEELAPTPLDRSILEPYRKQHEYLLKRGISLETLELFGCGFDSKKNAVTIPWFYPDGRLANVKYRRVDSKLFFYEKGAIPIRELVFGMDVVYREDHKIAVLSEAEIDAMYVRSATGYGAIGVGTNKLSDEKVSQIVRSPIEELVIFADNDDAGEELKKQAIRMLAPYVTIRVVNYPKKYKDPNDIKDVDELREYIEKAEIVYPTFW